MLHFNSPTNAASWRRRQMAVAALTLTLASWLHAQEMPDLSTPAAPGAAVYFIQPIDGAEVSQSFVVKFGLRGMGVAPAGIEMPGTGHHHLLINQPEVDLTLPLPTTDRIVHFGKGQTETTVTLPPGEHRLELLLGNHLHVPHSPPVRSGVIRVTVVAED